MMKHAAALLTLILLASCGKEEEPPKPPAPAEDPELLFDGKTLGDWEREDFVGYGGKVRIENGELRLDKGRELTGVRWKGEAPPTTNYEITLEARRVKGDDFFCGIVFPVGKSHCSFVAGGWGGSIIGLSSVDNMFADENETGRPFTFEENTWYKFRLRVTPKRVAVWIGEEQVIDLDLTMHEVEVHPSVEDLRPLGLASYNTDAAMRDIRLKKITGE